MSEIEIVQIAAGLSHHAQGAQHALPDGAPPPLASLLEAARRPPRPGRGHQGHPRLLRRPRLPAHGHAHPHAERLRGDDDPVRDRVLRPEGLPQPERPALQRSHGRGFRQGLLLRPDLPGREIQDPPPPHRVLDGRARGRLRHARGHHRARRGPHPVHHRARPDEAPGRAGDARARHEAARGDRQALPPPDLRRGRPHPPGEGLGDRVGRRFRRRPRRRSSPSSTIQPVCVTHFPAAIKAFYMQPDPENPDVALGVDFLAPEGYGEIIGGGQRIHDLGLLEQRTRGAQPAPRGLRMVPRPAQVRLGAPTPASAWASSGWSPGSAASSTSAKPSPSPGSSTGSILDPVDARRPGGRRAQEDRPDQPRLRQEPRRQRGHARRRSKRPATGSPDGPRTPTSSSSTPAASSGRPATRPRRRSREVLRLKRRRPRARGSSPPAVTSRGTGPAREASFPASTPGPASGASTGSPRSSRAGPSPSPAADVPLFGRLARGWFRRPAPGPMSRSPRAVPTAAGSAPSRSIKGPYRLAERRPRSSARPGRLPRLGVKEIDLVSHDTTWFGRDRGVRRRPGRASSSASPAFEDVAWIRFLYGYPEEIIGPPARGHGRSQDLPLSRHPLPACRPRPRPADEAGHGRRPGPPAPRPASGRSSPASASGLRSSSAFPGKGGRNSRPCGASSGRPASTISASSPIRPRKERPRSPAAIRSPPR